MARQSNRSVIRRLPLLVLGAILFEAIYLYRTAQDDRPWMFYGVIVAPLFGAGVSWMLFDALAGLGRAVCLGLHVRLLFWTLLGGLLGGVIATFEWHDPAAALGEFAWLLGDSWLETALAWIAMGAVIGLLQAGTHYYYDGFLAAVVSSSEEDGATGAE